MSGRERELERLVAKALLVAEHGSYEDSEGYESVHHLIAELRQKADGLGVFNGATLHDIDQHYGPAR